MGPEKKRWQILKKFVLVYPSAYPFHAGSDGELETTFNCLPIGPLCLASFVKSKGYEVILIDARLYDKDTVWKKISVHLEDALAIGFSCVTGQLGHGLLLADRIKSDHPGLPLIFGGIHPTLFPEQTIHDKAVDYAILGEGEFSLLELLSYLEGEAIRLSGISGLCYKENGAVNINPQPEPVDINLLPDPDYGLLDIEHYLDRELFFYTRTEKVRALDIYTSRGCPYRCSFCTNTLKAFKRWRPLEKDRVFRMVEELVKKYSLNYVKFTDDYFFGNRKHTLDLMQGIKELGLDFKWLGNIRVDCLEREIVNDEDFRVLRETGCLFLNVGIESGSQRVLDILKKDITPKQALDFFKTCYKHGIIPLATFMIGIPGEKREDREATIRLMDELFKACPTAILSPPGVFRPYPGTELYEECKKLGFKEPSSLRAWAQYDFEDATSNLFIKAADLPWVDDPSFIRDIGHYMFWYFDYLYNGEESGYSRARKILGKLSGFRVRHGFWFCRFEAFLIRLRKKIRKAS